MHHHAPLCTIMHRPGTEPPGSHMLTVVMLTHTHPMHLHWVWV